MPSMEFLPSLNTLNMNMACHILIQQFYQPGTSAITLKVTKRQMTNLCLQNLKKYPSYIILRIQRCANSVDPDETAPYEPHYLVLYC